MQLRNAFALSLSLFGLLRSKDAVSSSPAEDARTPSVAIVELFTSEGCSSCPPADELLRKVNLKQAPSGQLIVGISEHVTYWNHLGWKDPFSADTFTNRQYRYSQRLSPEGPYTPQMVVNGRSQFVGSSGSALADALRADASQDHADLRLLSSAVSPDGIDLDFALKGRPGKDLDVIAVVTDDSDRSHVLRGENSGELLQHAFVARSLNRVASVSGDTRKNVHIAWTGSAFQAGSGHHVILFAQEPQQGAIVGAVAASI